MPSAASHGDVQTAASCGCAAGVYTSPILIPLCATLLESFGALDRLEAYVSTNARSFYRLPVSQGSAKRILRREQTTVPSSFTLDAHKDKDDWARDKAQVVPFWAGKELPWKTVS